MTITLRRRRPAVGDHRVARQRPAPPANCAKRKSGAALGTHCANGLRSPTCQPGIDSEHTSDSHDIAGAIGVWSTATPLLTRRRLARARCAIEVIAAPFPLQSQCARCGATARTLQMTITLRRRRPAVGDHRVARQRPAPPANCAKRKSGAALGTHCANGLRSPTCQPGIDSEHTSDSHDIAGAIGVWSTATPLLTRRRLARARCAIEVIAAPFPLQSQCARCGATARTLQMTITLRRRRPAVGDHRVARQRPAPPANCAKRKSGAALGTHCANGLRSPTCQPGIDSEHTSDSHDIAGAIGVWSTATPLLTRRRLARARCAIEVIAAPFPLQSQCARCGATARTLQMTITLRRRRPAVGDHRVARQRPAPPANCAKRKSGAALGTHCANGLRSPTCQPGIDSEHTSDSHDIAGAIGVWSTATPLLTRRRLARARCAIEVIAAPFPLQSQCARCGATARTLQMTITLRRRRPAVGDHRVARQRPAPPANCAKRKSGAALGTHCANGLRSPTCQPGIDSEHTSDSHDIAGAIGVWSTATPLLTRRRLARARCAIEVIAAPFPLQSQCARCGATARTLQMTITLRRRRPAVGDHRVARQRPAPPANCAKRKSGAALGTHCANGLRSPTCQPGIDSEHTSDSHDIAGAIGVWSTATPLLTRRRLARARCAIEVIAAPFPLQSQCARCGATARTLQMTITLRRRRPAVGDHRVARQRPAPPANCAKRKSGAALGTHCANGLRSPTCQPGIDSEHTSDSHDIAGAIGVWSTATPLLTRRRLARARCAIEVIAAPFPLQSQCARCGATARTLQMTITLRRRRPAVGDHRVARQRPAPPANCAKRKSGAALGTHCANGLRSPTCQPGIDSEHTSDSHDIAGAIGVWSTATPLLTRRRLARARCAIEVIAAPFPLQSQCARCGATARTLQMTITLRRRRPAVGDHRVARQRPAPPANCAKRKSGAALGTHCANGLRSPTCQPGIDSEHTSDSHDIAGAIGVWSTATPLLTRRRLARARCAIEVIAAPFPLQSQCARCGATARTLQMTITLRRRRPAVGDHRVARQRPAPPANCAKRKSGAALGTHCANGLRSPTCQPGIDSEHTSDSHDIAGAIGVWSTATPLLTRRRLARARCAIEVIAAPFPLQSQCARCGATARTLQMTITLRRRRPAVGDHRVARQRPAPPANCAKRKSGAALGTHCANGLRSPTCQPGIDSEHTSDSHDIAGAIGVWSTATPLLTRRRLARARCAIEVIAAPFPLQSQCARCGATARTLQMTITLRRRRPAVGDHRVARQRPAPPANCAKRKSGAALGTHCANGLRSPTCQPGIDSEHTSDSHDIAGAIGVWSTATPLLTRRRLARARCAIEVIAAPFPLQSQCARCGATARTLQMTITLRRRRPAVGDHRVARQRPAPPANCAKRKSGAALGTHCANGLRSPTCQPGIDSEHTSDSHDIAGAIGVWSTATPLLTRRRLARARCAIEVIAAPFPLQSQCARCGATARTLQMTITLRRRRPAVGDHRVARQRPAPPANCAKRKSGAALGTHCANGLRSPTCQPGIDSEHTSDSHDIAGAIGVWSTATPLLTRRRLARARCAIEVIAAPFPLQSQCARCGATARTLQMTITLRRRRPAVGDHRVARQRPAPPANCAKRKSGAALGTHCANGLRSPTCQPGIDSEHTSDSHDIAGAIGVWSTATPLLTRRRLARARCAIEVIAAPFPLQSQCARCGATARTLQMTITLRRRRPAVGDHRVARQRPAPPANCAKRKSGAALGTHCANGLRSPTCQPGIDSEHTSDSHDIAGAIGVWSTATPLLTRRRLARALDAPLRSSRPPFPCRVSALAVVPQRGPFR